MGNLAKGNTTTLAAVGQAVPISTQITALFNRNTNYAQFLVTAIVPAIWQICVVVSTILILAAHFRLYGNGNNSFAFLGERPFTRLSKILSQYIPVFMAQGALFLVWFYMVLDCTDGRQLSGDAISAVRNDYRMHHHGGIVLLPIDGPCSRDELCWRIYRAKLRVYGYNLPRFRHECSCPCMERVAANYALHRSSSGPSKLRRKCGTIYRLTLVDGWVHYSATDDGGFVGKTSQHSFVK